MNNLRILALAIIFLSAAGCSKSTPAWEYMPDMYDFPSFKAQEADSQSPNGAAARLAPENTVSRDYQIYRYSAQDTEKAGRELKNPIPRTRSALERGQKVYNTYCIVCHGARGSGDGYIVPPYPRPPNLLSEKVAQWPDGAIFNVITRGQNLMPNYEAQVSAPDRWMTIHYIRALQRADNPTPEDLSLLKKSEGSK